MSKTNVGYFKEISRITNKFVEEICNNQDLCKMIYYGGSSNPLEENNIEDTNETLIGEYILRKPKYQFAESDKKVMLSVYLNDARPTDTNYISRKETFVIDIMVDIDLWDNLDDGSIRPYNIISILSEMFEGETFKGNDISFQIVQIELANKINFSDRIIGYRLFFGLINHGNVKVAK